MPLAHAKPSTAGESCGYRWQNDPAPLQVHATGNVSTARATLLSCSDSSASLEAIVPEAMLRALDRFRRSPRAAPQELLLPGLTTYHENVFCLSPSEMCSLCTLVPGSMPRPRLHNTAPKRWHPCSNPPALPHSGQTDLGSGLDWMAAESAWAQVLGPGWSLQCGRREQGTKSPAQRTKTCSCSECTRNTHRNHQWAHSLHQQAVLGLVPALCSAWGLAGGLALDWELGPTHLPPLQHPCS